jgi:hypothetical protein
MVKSTNEMAGDKRNTSLPATKELPSTYRLASILRDRLAGISSCECRKTPLGQGWADPDACPSAGLLARVYHQVNGTQQAQDSESVLEPGIRRCELFSQLGRLLEFEIGSKVASGLSD